MLRLLLTLFAANIANYSFAQKAPSLDILDVAIGRPFPLPAFMPFKNDGSALPFYTFSAPIPSASRFRIFVDYMVYAMKDNGHVYALHANRTFESNDECARALNSLIAPSVEKYQLVSRKSEPTLFQATSKDVEVEFSCSYTGGAPPYSTFNLRISSISEKQRVNEQMRKNFAR